jgi:hypothetical protein
MAHVNKTYIFDLELSTPIITDGSEPGYGIVEYVTNWKDHHLMKVACLCAIELNNEAAPLVFLQDNLEGFSDLITEDAFFCFVQRKSLRPSRFAKASDRHHAKSALRFTRRDSSSHATAGKTG